VSIDFPDKKISKLTLISDLLECDKSADLNLADTIINGNIKRRDCSSKRKIEAFISQNKMYKE